MQYLTVEEINRIDRLASEKYGIPSIVLMENAGRSVAEETVKLIANCRLQIANCKIAVLCGSGKNGGDGFVAARYLYNYGYQVKVYLLKNPNNISGDTLTNYTILKKIGVETKLISPGKLNSLSSELKKANCIIDAIFGTGIKGKVTGLPAQIIKMVNQTKEIITSKPVISVDLPSGLDGDTGFPSGKCVKTTVTVTMGYPKKGFLNPKAKKYLGKLIIADIGYPRNITRNI